MATPFTARKEPDPAPLPAPSRVFLTVKQLPEQQPALSVAGIRWAIFNEDNNGLAESGAVVRVGRRVLIDPDKFLAWMSSNPTLSPPKPKAGQKAAPRRHSLPRPVATLGTE